MNMRKIKSDLILNLVVLHWTQAKKWIKSTSFVSSGKPNVFLQKMEVLSNSWKFLQAKSLTFRAVHISTKGHTPFAL